MSTEKITVNIDFTARYQVSGSTEMTKADYAQWCSKIDNAKGFEREEVAKELIHELGIRLERDGELDEFEVEDFSAPAIDG